MTSTGNEIEAADLRCRSCHRPVDDIGDDLGGARFGHSDGTALCRPDEPVEAVAVEQVESQP